MGLDMEIRHNGEEVIYMRKENAIRRWFAENLENFEDNGLTNIPKEKFEEIVEAMSNVIVEGGIHDFYMRYANCLETDDNDMYRELVDDIHKFVEDGGEKYEKFCNAANKYLPSEAGFFFGSTDYHFSYIRGVCLYYYKFDEFLNEMNESGEEWDEGTVEYWEWY